MSAIGPHHQEEISKFLKFFRSRLKTHLENVDGDFEDTRSDRLSSDDVYSQKDVQDVLKSLNFAVKASVRSEQQDTINMMALLLRQVFAEAETKKLVLELDIGQVEDREILEKVEKLSVSEWIDEDFATSSKSKKKGPASPSKQQLEQQLKQQHEQEIRQAKRTNELQQDEHEREMKQIQRKLHDAQDKIDDLTLKLEDMQKHISQTKQFQSMKAMVAQKNSQLTELRRRLQRYEPDDGEDDGKNADDDD